MKKSISLIFVLVFLLIANAALAATATLSWNANTTTPDGYRIFARTSDQSAYNYENPVYDGKETTGDVNGLEEGVTYHFVVRAYVGALESVDSEEVSFTPEISNQAPVADAGSNQTVKEGDSVILNAGNSTDLDDGIASYSWKQISGTPVEILNANAQKASFAAPYVGMAGDSLVFELTVADHSGVTSTATCTINVTWVNVAPIANAGSEYLASEGDVVTLSADGSSDADNGIVSYKWEQISGTSVSLSSKTGKTVSFTAPMVAKGGETLKFKLTVTDAGNLTDTAIALVTIEHENMAPIADAGDDQDAVAGDKVALDGTISVDPEGDDLTYRWTQTHGMNVTLSDPTAANPTFIAPNAGVSGAELIFTLTVTDSEGLKSQDSCKVTIAPVEEKDTIAPSLKMNNISSLVSASSLTLKGTADDNVNVSKITWKTNKGYSGTASGTASWTANVPLSFGSNSITVTAIDAAGNETSITKKVTNLKLF